MSRMEASEKRRIVEALVLSSPEPISAEKIAEIIPYCKPGQAKDLINELNTEYAEQDRAFEIWEVAGGFQIRTRAEFSGYLQKLQKERALRLSQAALETLAIIAYRQPVTRAEIEDVRGVDAGATVKSLLERHLVRIAGQREVPGRPMLYATTRRFLEVFGLERLKDLPTLRELDELAREQGLIEKTAAEIDVEGEGEGDAGGEIDAEVDPQAPADADGNGDRRGRSPGGGRGAGTGGSLSMPHGASPRHARKSRKQAGPARGANTRAATERGEGSSRSSSAAPIPEFDGTARLQKLLAAAGLGSRRDVERYLREERVTVNGRVARLGDKANPSVDEIRVDGERLARERPAYWIVNKPRGVVTTLRDEAGRRTVVDLVPPRAGRLFPVGRLDRETSGLLLMTNDGDVAPRLAPSLTRQRARVPGEREGARRGTYRAAPRARRPARGGAHRARPGLGPALRPGQ